MRILIVEDTIYKRRILESILLEDKHEVILAGDGVEAVAIFKAEQPDMVLMDVVLPEMDGYVATSQIKALCGDRFVPIIFITTLTGSNVLEKCIECGGDDILSGPYDHYALLAKIAAMARIQRLHEKLNDQTTQLQKHKHRVQRELSIAEHVFSTILDRGDLSHASINYSLSPMSLFSGDILLCAHTPSGGMHIMLGDFTGHGLSAAIGAMPTSDIFYTMTASGFSIGDIAAEMNRRLFNILPTGMFCAASIVELDLERTTVSIWNGGMPDILITDKDGNIEHHIASSHQALGVRPEDKFERKTEIIPVNTFNKIYIYSDGLIEAKNRRDRKFGMKNLCSQFPQAALSDPPLSDLLDNLKTYTAGCDQSDDISIAEISTAINDTWRADQDSKSQNRMAPSTWDLSLRLNADTLRAVNPVPLLLNLIMGVQAPQGHRERIFTILSELFSNSLDHGLLGVDSAMKSNATGFAEYYRLREKRLAKLEDGQIDIKLNHQSNSNQTSGKFIIKVKDSGSGFNHNAVFNTLKSNQGYSGRGIALVKSLCKSVNYRSNGNQVEATYEWNRK